MAGNEQKGTASRIWRKSEDERSNGQSRPVIYPRLGTMHHASRCCRRRIQLCRYTIARFELCIGQYVVHPLNHDDLQLSQAGHRYRCLYLTSFVRHTIDEIKTATAEGRVSCLPLSPSIVRAFTSRFVQKRSTNGLPVFRWDNNVSKITLADKGEK